MGPLLKFVQVPLDGVSSFFGISLTTQLSVICKRAEGTLNHVVYVVDKSKLLMSKASAYV